MTFSLRIAADINHLAAIRRFVEEAGAALQMPAKALDDLVLAVDESVTNIIVHGYQGQPGGIEIQIWQAEEAVMVHLRDQAPLFDPTRLPDPDVTLTLDRRPIGGMGVYLTRRLVDVVSYRPTDQGGNELTLIKKIIPPHPTSQEASHGVDG